MTPMKTTKKTPSSVVCTPFPDYLNISALLSDEQKLIQSTVREFIAKEVEPLIKDSYRNEDLPRSIIPRMGELGLLGSNLISS